MSTFESLTELTPEVLGIEPESLKFIRPYWKRTYYQAVINWLTKYIPKVDAPNLEKIHGYLESFHHLYDAEDWEGASKILLGKFRLSNNQELGLQLGIWGDAYLQIELYTKLNERVNHQTKAICLHGIATGYRFFDKFVEAQAFCSEALDLFLQLGEKERGAWILHDIGLMEADQGKDTAANAYYKRALALFSELQTYKGIALVLNDMARVEANQGNYVEAVRLYKKSLYEYLPKAEDETARAWILHNLGRALADQGEYAEARNYTRGGLKLFRKLDNKTGIGWSLYNLSALMLNVERYRSASVYGEEALTLFRKLNNKTGICFTLQILGRLAFKQAKYSISREYYREKILIWQELESLPGIAQALEGFARLLSIQERSSYHAVRLFGAAEVIREVSNFPIPLPDYVDYESAVVATREQVDADTFAMTWASGRSMSIEQAIAEALEHAL